MAQDNKKGSMTQFLAQANVNSYITSIVGEKKDQFIASVTALANSSPELKRCDPNSLLAVAITALTLDLSINPNLGYAWAVPYGDKATFQIGANGYKQLAMRTNKYSKINVTPIYKTQFKSWNPLTEELDIDMTAEPEGEVHGYAAYYRRKDGFDKTVYWTRDKVLRHAKQYSKSFNSRSSPWQTSFDKMAEKTVIKDLLKNWAELSTESDSKVTEALAKDQASISINYDTGEEDIEYVDNPEMKDVTPRITKEQAGKLVSLAKGHQKAAMGILASFGYKDIVEVLEEDYDKVLSLFEKIPDIGDKEAAKKQAEPIPEDEGELPFSV